MSTIHQEGAVAIDLGASSARIATGRIVNAMGDRGHIQFEVIEQIAHQPHQDQGKLVWDIRKLQDLSKRAVQFAQASFARSTLAIDAWGVDHGFLDKSGALISPPVCYRDRSHTRAFETLTAHRSRLFELTGIQHQPFNSICQLIARRKEDPSLPERSQWLMLPDLLGHLLGGEPNMELTQASTTQLMDLDNRWSAELFDLIGWPVPPLQPSQPGTISSQIADGVHLAHVGSHDTASAMVGFGRISPETMVVNVGTWSLAMITLDQPLSTPSVEQAQMTNERTADGRVRLTKNIPGFYVLNRLHEELGVLATVPEWLASSQPTDESLNLMDEAFFNPPSMVELCISKLGRNPNGSQDWASVAISSLALAIAAQVEVFGTLTGRRFCEIRMGGGGSQSAELCRAVAKRSRLPVYAGPVEATLLGNLAVQFLASGVFEDRVEMAAWVDRSFERSVYEP
jgi:rhamnulokinase